MQTSTVFKSGQIVDTHNNVSIQLINNPKVGDTVFNRASESGYEKVLIPAFETTGQGQYALCTFRNLNSPAEMVNWARNGFSVEAYYVSSYKKDIQGIVCATETVSGTNGGWGIAEKESGKPYFITASTAGYESANTTAQTVSSDEELVHVVAVYDPNAGGTYGKQFLYINGVCVNEEGEPLDGTFAPIGDANFNKFCLGADIRSLGQTKVNGVYYQADFSTIKLKLVNVKIYELALDSEGVETAHTAAQAILAGAPLKADQRDWNEAFTPITTATQDKYYFREQMVKKGEAYVAAYDKIYNAILNFETFVSVSGVSDVNTIFRHVLDDHHELFWVNYPSSGGLFGTEYIAYFSQFSKSNIGTYQAQIDAFANKVLSGITPEMTESERVKYIYDYIMDTMAYGDTEGTYVHTIYGAFVENRPVCDGYTHAFGYLLQKVGIESFEILGYTKSDDTGAHAWSGVKIDGRYTIFDITFSDTGNNDRYRYYDVPTMHDTKPESGATVSGHFVDPEFTSDFGISLPVFS